MTDSRTFGIGDWVEVRSLEEVLLTLDDTNSLAALPFMPEMAKFCGKRFRIVKSAHKTCDPTGCSKLRRFENAVHLDTRCDGSGHDGCEARCLIVWKTDWLKKVEPDSEARPPAAAPEDIGRLQQTTRVDAKRYRCQLTHLVDATTELRWWTIGHYIEDLTSRNISPMLFLKTVPITFAVELYSRITGHLRRAIRRFLPKPQQIPQTAAVLNLQPCDLVQVRSKQEILATLDANRKLRGLSFEREMFRYCGGTYRVSHRIKKAISEHTGKMLNFKNDCIVLEGVACRGLDGLARLFCQRAALFFWREAWLRRATNTDTAGGMNTR
jgi:hypothetical protein